MSGLLTGMGPRGTALALLVLGHVLADFALQSDWMVEGKPDAAPLLTHGLVVVAAHAIALTPMLTQTTALIVLGLASAHILIDLVKSNANAQWGSGFLGLFLLDQASHLLTIMIAWRFIPPSAWMESPVVHVLDGVPYQAWTLLASGAIYVSAFVSVHHAGNAIVRGLLPPFPMVVDESDRVVQADLPVGRIIGTLERILIMILVLVGQWKGIPLVLGAKATIRRKFLMSRASAEYFLVGTLASVLVAVALGLGVQALV